MGLKSMIKKALFAFFKEQILQFTDYNKPTVIRPQPEQLINQLHKEEIKITKLRSRVMLPFGDRAQEFGAISSDMVYKKALDEAKKSLFEEATQFIRVEEEEKHHETDPNFCPIKVVDLSIYIGVPAPYFS